MEFLLDTANLKEIEGYNQVISCSGLTTNPSIIKKENGVDFIEHILAMRSLVGQQTPVHVQVVATDFEGILKDAHYILENLGQDVYVKVPVNKYGLRAIKVLKKENIKITATAIYTKMQGYLAIEAGADYIAPYFNRMENLNIDAKEVITELRRAIDRDNSKTKILAASFKNVGQVNAAFECGAHAATMGVDILDSAFDMPSINKAVADFSSDWQSVYGTTSLDVQSELLV